MLHVYVVSQMFSTMSGDVHDISFHLCHLEKFSKEEFQKMIDQASKHFVEEIGDDCNPDNPYVVQLKDFLCNNYGFKEIKIEQYAFYDFDNKFEVGER